MTDYNIMSRNRDISWWLLLVNIRSTVTGRTLGYVRKLSMLPHGKFPLYVVGATTGMW
jgi:hypothetical protein